ncbi:hypothetical protein STEG23_030082, partial [Scotinomys teguina]
EEGVRNFKELRAKFQKFDVPPFPGPIKLPASVSRKDDRGHTQSAQSPASGKYLSSNHHHQLLSYSSNEVSQPPKSQEMKSVQRGEVQKNSSSSGPPEKSAVCPARHSQKAAMPLDVRKSKAETSNEEKGIVSSFRFKLWNWEKFLSQNSEMSPAPPLINGGNKTFHVGSQKTMGLAQIKPEKSPEHGRKGTESPGAEESPRSSLCQPVYEYELTSPVSEKPESRHQQLPNIKPLPSVESLGPPPQKPSKPPLVDLEAFHRWPTAISKTLKEVTAKEGPLTPDGAELEESHNYDTTISYLSHSGNSINLYAAGEMSDATYEIEIEELPKPWGSFLHLEPSPRPKDEENNTKEKEPRELDPQKQEGSHPGHPSEAGVYEGTPKKVHMAGVHEGRRRAPAGNQEAMMDVTLHRLFPGDMMLTRPSQDKSGYVEALEVTKETPGPSAIRSNSSSEETYDDVGGSIDDLFKWNFSRSDSEENSEDTYEDIYKAKNNDQKTNVDGRAALSRLRHLFRKERGMFGAKKTQSNVSNGFSMSLPDLGLRSQDITIYDDVDTSEKESKDEDKLKTWKLKFLTSKWKRRGKDSDGSKSFSPRKFFRTKKHNLQKNRMEKEEKLFRERFQYGKEIVVINRAVACSSNSQNGIFDLPITPGEQLDVIDTTEQNLVICRNSKGKCSTVKVTADQALEVHKGPMDRTGL